MYGLKKRSKQDENGLIQGAGTGTSDDIKKNVPAGSYIMPADSTAQLGARNLKNLGKPPTTEVNVSNGEYLATPEQLQAIGGLVLDRMKQQTHVPTENKQGFGFKSKAAPQNQQPQSANLGFNPDVLAQYQDNIKVGESGKPEMFFAEGTPASGVPDLLKRREQNPLMNQGVQNTLNNSFGKSAPLGLPQNNTTSQQNSGFGAFAKNMIAPEHDDGSWNAVGGLVNTATGLGKAGVGAVGGLMGGIAEGARSLGSWVANGDNSNRGNIVGPSFDFAGDGLKQAQLGLRQTFGLTPNQEESANLPSSTPKSAPVTSNVANTAVSTDKKPTTATPPPVTNTDVKPIVNTNTQAPPKPDPFVLNSGQTPTTTTQPQANPYAIQQKGNAFSYVNPNAAAQARANGVPELQSSGVQKGVGINGIKDFMTKTPEINLGMQGYGNIERRAQAPQRTPEQEAERQSIMRAASTPYAGARNGQLTAAQLRVQADMNQGDANRENDIYKTDANNDATLQREAMSQAGATGRTALEQQAANWRTGAGLDLESQKFNATNDLANRQFSEEQLNNMPARMKQAYELNLLKQYEAAQTPEERQSLSERLGMVRGQQAERSGNPYMQIKQGEVVNEKGEVTQPSKEYLYNTKTGETIDPLASIRSQAQIPQAAIDDLKKDPSGAKEFDALFGQGSAAKYLKG